MEKEAVEMALGCFLVPGCGVPVSVSKSLYRWPYFSHFLIKAGTSNEVHPALFTHVIVQTKLKFVCLCLCVWEENISNEGKLSRVFQF